MQSHYREVSWYGDFYGTGIEIWAGFWSIGSTEKKGSGRIMSNFLGWLFHLWGKKNIFLKVALNEVFFSKNLKFFLKIFTG